MRPTKTRRIACLPDTRFFYPKGKGSSREKICLQLDEFEAIRLFDGKGLTQPEAAKQMQISRPTFSRILSRARRKIAQSLVEIKPLWIEGGCCEVSSCAIKKKIGR